MAGILCSTFSIVNRILSYLTNMQENLESMQYIRINNLIKMTACAFTPYVPFFFGCPTRGGTSGRTVDSPLGNVQLW